MVRYLAYFMRNDTESLRCSYIVNVFDEIENYKSQNPGRKPIIVFDYVSTLTLFVKNKNDIISSGRHSLCYHKSEEFCKRLVRSGAKLMFFIDGPIKPFKFSLWLERKNKKYEMQEENIFSKLRKGEQPFLRYTGQMIGSYFDLFLPVAQKYGTIFVSLKNECDIDLATFATTVNATAVFALDTDFLIMPGDWAIWSTEKFNFDNFTTVAWNKYNLRRKLQLRQNQMPIFATLVGNDFIQTEKVEYLWRREGEPVNLKILADYVREHFPRGVPLNAAGYEKLVAILFKNGENGYKNLDEAKRLISSSIDFYDYGKHSMTVNIPDWLREHIQKTGSSFIYELYSNFPIIIHHSYIDLSKMDVKPFSELVLPILRRQLGIFHYEKRKMNSKYAICLKRSHEEPFSVYTYTALYPENLDIPEMPVLLGHVIEKENISKILTDENKFEIFKWTVMPRKGKLTLDTLLELDKTPFLLPILIIYYLKKEIQITLEEADVLLLAVMEANKCSLDKLESIIPPERYKERPLWIAFCFVQLNKTFTNSLLISGLFEHIKCFPFDGFIFHKMYDKFITMAADTKAKLIEPYLQYRIYCK